MQIITQAKGWAILDDGLQWALCREYVNATTGKTGFRAITFVRSSKAVLVRCMREFGIPRTMVVALTRDLPDCYDLYAESVRTKRPVSRGASEPSDDIPMPPPEKRTTAPRNQTKARK